MFLGSMGAWIRRTGFLALDFLTGGKVIKHYRDISNKMEGKKTCFNELPNLLFYVKENVPYYENIKGLNLYNFPVINKQDIMANYDAFQSREYIGTSKLHWTSTSGSTGTPFRASQNPDKRNRTIADLIYFHKNNGWNLGDRYIFLRAWTSNYSFSKLKLLLQNFIAVDVVDFDNPAKESMRQTLKRDKKIKVLLGYASAMQDFVFYLEEQGDCAEMFNLNVIFTGSDNLSDTTKEKLEKMFGCPVINRYSNEEHGVLACTSATDSTFRLNTASYYFELLKPNSDEPVKPGEIGRLVVTDLYNRSLPFIRYDTGDLAISHDLDIGYLKTLSSFQGRIADTIYSVNGNMISAAVVNNYLHACYEVKQYQLIQKAENVYLLKVVCESNYYSREYLSNICKKFLGEEAIIDIEYCDAISAEDNGKFKTVVNCLNKASGKL